MLGKSGLVLLRWPPSKTFNLCEIAGVVAKNKPILKSPLAAKENSLRYAKDSSYAFVSKSKLDKIKQIDVLNIFVENQVILGVLFSFNLSWNKYIYINEVSKIGNKNLHFLWVNFKILTNSFPNSTSL